MSNPHYINDSVYGLVRFAEKPEDRLLRALLDTPEVQRLRRIRQLGMAELVFPGAVHTRLSHALGVVHQARGFLERIEELGHALTDRVRIVILSAALLHDLGHGPFSHVFERASGELHVERTIEIISDPSTGVHQVLRQHDEGLPSLLEHLFTEGSLDDEEGWLPCLWHIISSQMDADRFDFLLRDSQYAGVNYGRFDSEWLVKHLELTSNGLFYVPRKALAAAEGFVLARHHMYLQVYYHRGTRAAEAMLTSLLRRYKALVCECKGEGAAAEVVPEAPSVMHRTFSDGPMALEDYLRLDDDVLRVFIGACEESEDQILRTMAWELRNRRLWSYIDVTGASMPDVARFVSAVTDMLRESGLEGDFAFVDDTPADTPYLTPYNPKVAADPILVENASGSIVEITDDSRALRNLADTYTFVRYYFPRDLYEPISALAKTNLKRQ